MHMWGGRKPILVRWIICHEPFRRFISFATLRFADVQFRIRRPAMWYHIVERAARDRRFFSKARFFLQPQIYWFIWFRVSTMYFARIDGAHWRPTERPNETRNMHKYVFVFVLCVGRSGDIMCVTTAVAFEQNFLHYNLALYLHCHVYWIML